VAVLPPLPTVYDIDTSADKVMPPAFTGKQPARALRPSR
jgi:hypothetical protein